MKNVIEKKEQKYKYSIHAINIILIATIFDDVLYPADYSLIDRYYEQLARKYPGYWDGKNDEGELVPPGVYIFKIIACTEEVEYIKEVR